MLRRNSDGEFDREPKTAFPNGGAADLRTSAGTVWVGPGWGTHSKRQSVAKATVDAQRNPHCWEGAPFGVSCIHVQSWRAHCH